MLLRTAALADSRLRLVLTMRSDFLGQCDVFLGLPEAISGSQFLVPRLSRSQMEEAIVRPGRIRLPEIEPFDFGPGMVTHLINEAGDRPDQLPLLQHVLMRMWKCAQDSHRRTLTEDDYTEVGGISKSLSDDADAAWRALPDDLSLIHI